MQPSPAKVVPAADEMSGVVPVPPRKPGADGATVPKACDDSSAWAVECQEKLMADWEKLANRHRNEISALLKKSLDRAQAGRVPAGEPPSLKPVMGAELQIFKTPDGRPGQTRPHQMASLPGYTTGLLPVPNAQDSRERVEVSEIYDSELEDAVALIPGVPAAQASNATHGSNHLQPGSLHKSISAPVSSSSSVPERMETAKMTVGSVEEEGGEQSWRDMVAKKVDKARGKNKNTKKDDALLQSKKARITAEETLLQRVVSNKRYAWVSSVIIITNAFFIGLQTQWSAARSNDLAEQGLPPDPDTPWGFQLIEICFCIAFVVELGLRWIAEGFRGFFTTSEVHWNVFDVFVVSVTVIEVVIDLFFADGGLGHSVLGTISILRILRVVSMVRLAKVIRVVRFFRELRMMIMSILSSLKSLAWAMIILALVFFVFGVAVTNGTITFLDNVRANASDDAGEHDEELLRKYFGTLSKSVMSLYMAMSGGKDWGDYYEVIEPVGPMMSFIFIFFISFAIFAVVNIVTGIFVETAMQCNLSDREVIIQDELEKQKEILNCISSIFEELDMDGTGLLSKAEFEGHLHDERVIAYFEFLELDVSDARTLFMLLDYDQSGEIEINEFVTGCLKLKGGSRSLDIAMLRYEVAWLQSALKGFADYTERHFQRLLVAVGVHSCIPSPQPSNAGSRCGFDAT